MPTTNIEKNEPVLRAWVSLRDDRRKIQLSKAKLMKFRFELVTFSKTFPARLDVGLSSQFCPIYNPRYPLFMTLCSLIHNH